MSIGERILLRLSRDPDDPSVRTDPAAPSLEHALDHMEFRYPGFTRLIAGKTVLDFGCGDGLQAVAMARAGAERVLGVDFNPTQIAACRALAGRERMPVEQVDFALEWDEGSFGRFDIVLSKDSMEHFPDPEGTFDLLCRAVRPGGLLIVTFGPPWFAPYGSHMHFFTPVPWLQLLFPESTVMKVRSRFRSDGARRYEDVESGLNRMTLRKFEAIVRRSSFLPEYRRYRCVKGADGLGRIPLVRELFVNDVTVVLRRPEGARATAP